MKNNNKKRNETMKNTNSRKVLRSSKYEQLWTNETRIRVNNEK